MSITDYPFIDAHARPIPERCIGLARLLGAAFRGEDLMPLVQRLRDHTRTQPDDWGAVMDMALLYMILGDMDTGLAMQAHVLDHRQCFREEDGREGGRRVLALAAPGDLMSNTPLQFMLEDSGICLDIMYVTATAPLPGLLDTYDTVIVTAGESDANHGILDRIEAYLHAVRPGRIVNPPHLVRNTSRTAVSQLLHQAPGVFCPTTIRTDMETLGNIGNGDTELGALLDGKEFPIIARPVGSHAGKGLERLERAGDIARYLNANPSQEYFIAPFIDYRSNDGQFRKYRIAMIDGRPHICHLAISDHWMIHYLNAGMRESIEKRQQEADVFASFDHAFAKRHAMGFSALQERIGLEYFVIDCAETRSGELLIFEIDTAMIIHSMDPHDLFPYKRPRMLQAFEAFQNLLSR